MPRFYPILRWEPLKLGTTLTHWSQVAVAACRHILVIQGNTIIKYFINLFALIHKKNRWGSVITSAVAHILSTYSKLTPDKCLYITMMAKSTLVQ